MEIDQACALFLEEIKPITDTEICPLSELPDRVFAEDISSPMNVPHFPKSAMDGYALRSGDTKGAGKENPVRLKVIGELDAGDSEIRTVSSSVNGTAGYVKRINSRPDNKACSYRSDQPGKTTGSHGAAQPEKASGIDRADQPEKTTGIGRADAPTGKREENLPPALRIMTGALIPDGFDSVIKQEDTDLGEDIVSIFKETEPYANYCPVGENIRQGELLVKKGTVAGRAEIGMLAMAGISRAKVVRKPGLYIISTGSELTLPGVKLEKGRIYANIAPMLSLTAEKLGARLIGSIITGDDEEEIKQAIKSAEEKSDIIITTGGVSVGKKDLLPKVLFELGARQVFTRVRIQPGTPTTGSILNGKPVLSLSGNPFAALANFDFYFPQMMEKMTGQKEKLRLQQEAVLAAAYEKNNPVPRLVRAKEEGGTVYFIEGSSKSSVISNLSESNCYALIPTGGAEKGSMVRIIRIMQ